MFLFPPMMVHMEPIKPVMGMMLTSTLHSFMTSSCTSPQRRSSSYWSQRKQSHFLATVLLTTLNKGLGTSLLFLISDFRWVKIMRLSCPSCSYLWWICRHLGVRKASSDLIWFENQIIWDFPRISEHMQNTIYAFLAILPLPTVNALHVIFEIFFLGECLLAFLALREGSFKKI